MGSTYRKRPLCFPLRLLPRALLNYYLSSPSSGYVFLTTEDDVAYGLWPRAMA